MAADGQLLQGEVVENPGSEDRNVERLLAGFLRALLDEQRTRITEELPKGSSVLAGRLENG